MQATIISLGTILLFGFSYFVLTKISLKRSTNEKLIVSEYKKRSTFLRNKVLQLLEIEKKHQHHLKILENEIEQLQQDVALKHNSNRI